MSAFRSADRVWTNLRRSLPEAGVEIVPDDPEIWLWDAFRQLPDSTRPLVAVLHEAPGDDEGLAPLLVGHADRIGRTIAERADQVLTCSAASRNGIARRYGIPPDRITIAPYGVDASVFRATGPTATRALLDAGGDSRPYVLFVGTVLPRKNLPLLREAMAQLPSHQLVVVASHCIDTDSSALLAAATSPINGRAVPNLAGIDVEGLAALMRGADVLCLPSLSEGFGLPVAEAMACGTPVVVSDRGALPEVAGDGGVVVPPTVSGIVEGIAAVLADRPALARRALARACDLTWDQTARIIARCLVDTLRRVRPA